MTNQQGYPSSPSVISLPVWLLLAFSLVEISLSLMFSFALGLGLTAILCSALLPSFLLSLTCWFISFRSEDDYTHHYFFPAS
jgi:hypothetical protein